MVFWSTLLAFTIGIMYYMFYPSDDKIKDVYMPTSEAFVSGFLAQHQAAKTFARESVIAIIKLTKEAKSSGKVFFSGSMDEENTVIILTDEDSSKNLIDKYVPNYTNKTETGSLKPGYYEGTFNQNFTSVLACFDKPERKLPDGSYVSAKLVNCNKATTKYVMTYGAVPLDDLETPYTRGRTVLWEPAILKRTHGSPDCGFLYSQNGRYYINNSKRLTRTVPSDFVNHVLNGYVHNTGNGRAFIRIGTTSGTAEADVLFCMTPINDTYPRLGLEVLLDSEHNTFETPGTTPKYFNLAHTDNINDKWVNLAKEDEEIQIMSAGDEQWFDSICPAATDNSISASGCRERENKNAFSFNSNRYFKVNPAGKNNKDFLGTSFTISMMIALNENGTVFETRGMETQAGCTPSTVTKGGTVYQKPCLKAEYTSGTDDGMYTVTVTNLDTNGDTPIPIESRLSTERILNRTPIQVDYIFNGTEHRLYMNGQLVDHDTLTNMENIEGFQGQSLTFGGITTANLYNLAIYNRGGMSDVTLNGKFDMYGLPRIFKSNTKRYKK